MTSPSLRGADIVMRTLERAGHNTIFTLSGNHIMSLFDAAIDTRARRLLHVAARGGRGAHGRCYGRLTGEPGIAMVTGGPGHANAVGALFTALGQEAPLVLLSGHTETDQLGRGGFQELRQVEMAAPVTKGVLDWPTDTATRRHGCGEGDPHRAVRTSWSGASQSAVRSARCDGAGDAIAWPDEALSPPRRLRCSDAGRRRHPRRSSRPRNARC